MTWELFIQILVLIALIGGVLDYLIDEWRGK